MKKRLVTYLLVSALAAAVFAGCSKKDGGDAADAAATDATVVEEAAEDAGAAATASLEDVAAAAEAADAEEAGAVADTTVAAEVADEEVAAVEDESVTEFVDEEVKEDADKEDADKKDAEEAEVLVVDPGTTYTVRFGGNIYSSPEENAANVMYYANPGDYLTIVERLDNYWYKVSYYLAGEGIEHIGYIQIQ